MHSDLWTCYCLLMSSRVSLGEPLLLNQGDIRGFAVVIGLKRSSPRGRLRSGLTTNWLQTVILQGVATCQTDELMTSGGVSSF
jgi:hypothetical protein